MKKLMSFILFFSILFCNNSVLFCSESNTQPQNNPGNNRKYFALKLTAIYYAAITSLYVSSIVLALNGRSVSDNFEGVAFVITPLYALGLVAGIPFFGLTALAEGLSRN